MAKVPPPVRGGARAGRAEPVFPYLSALRAAKSVGKIPESLILVGMDGFESLGRRL